MFPAVVGLLTFSVIALLLGKLSSHVHQSGDDLERRMKESERFRDAEAFRRAREQHHETGRNESNPTAWGAATGSNSKDEPQSSGIRR
jgi:hypothetical protein